MSLVLAASCAMRDFITLSFAALELIGRRESITSKLQEKLMGQQWDHLGNWREFLQSYESLKINSDLIKLLFIVTK